MVELVKSNIKAVTLAIGDGANDVSMIKCKFITKLVKVVPSLGQCYEGKLCTNYVQSFVLLLPQDYY